ncbi:MAG: pyridoxamine 5'-phosphate oxidase family protein [Myxacorys chilensis ATA2-1-KO14]|nr:pyridoxamine 5'-phosphate oxidase family protein [Myxacorys chilensis ATA2-1-KO14]
MPFHDGEIQVQTRAGVRAEAEQLSRVISKTLKPAAVEFLRAQPFAIAGSISPDDRVWASLLTGVPGFVQSIDPQTIQIKTNFSTTDPLHQSLQSNSQIGLLIIDLANRRRLRVNGRVTIATIDYLQIQIQQAFFNCPKYIQTREVEFSSEPLPSPKVQVRNLLTDADRDAIAQTDTFFIASTHSQQGADVSHRGGYPGFVRVIDATTLVFPDYVGNNMFQTLGNLSVNPNAGLLLIDFEQGHTLQLSGQAKIVWDAEQLKRFVGAQRLIEFSIEQVRETQHATPLRWRFGELFDRKSAITAKLSGG